MTDSAKSDFLKFDLMVARKMWEADERPCKWSDLERDEQAEWAIMAGAARRAVVEHMQHHIKHTDFKLVLARDEAAIVQDLSRRIAQKGIDAMMESENGKCS